MKTIKPPVAKKIASVKKIHGTKLIDNYAWLKADNWQEIMQNPESVPDDINDYLTAENNYCQKIMRGTSALQKKLFTEMKGRIKQNDSSVPAKYGKFFYQLKYKKNKEYPLYVRKVSGGKQETLFDGNLEARGLRYFDLAAVKHSPNHKKIAWGFDGNGSEFYTLKIRNIKSNNVIDEIDKVGSYVWGGDSATIIYVRVDELHRPNKVVVRKGAREKIIFSEKDARFFVGVEKSVDGKTIIINSSVNDMNENMFVDSAKPFATPTIIAKRKTGHEYNVRIEGGKIYILTNANGENFSIMVASKNKPQQKFWQPLVPHKKNVIIKDFFVLKNFLVRLEKENALPRIVVRNLATNVESVLDFSQQAYSLHLQRPSEFNSSCFNFGYSSMAEPLQIWQYDIATNKRKLLKQQKIPSGHDSKNYIVKRLYAPAHDGETIPISLLMHRKTKTNAPCLLYGYGSYGMGMDAGFNSARLSLVDRGFVYAIAHIRGGDEKGRHWYLQTKKHGKTKTFNDFISCAKYLCQKKYTSPKKIVAHGGSAGGLLMGAVANMEKNLWGGIVAQVPFVDVLNTMLDEKLPLTPSEWSQWGNPIKSKQEFEIIKSYSPYDNIEARKYPPMLVMAGLTDPRVQYWEPAKWVAKLREIARPSQLLLKTNMGSGHFGDTGRFAHLKEVAFVHSFILKCLRI